LSLREVIGIMPTSLRPCSVLGVVLLTAAALGGQSASDQDRPARAEPVKATTRQELDRLEALKLYGLAAFHEKNHRLLEAVKAYEAAHRLDPDAAAPVRALVPLYLALERTDDALAGCRRVLELDPDDFATAHLYARQLRNLERPREAITILARAAAAPKLKERPALRTQICFDLGSLSERAGDAEQAEKAFREVIDVLEHPAALLEQGPFTREEINDQAAETYERLGRVCLKLRQPDKAVAAFTQAQKKDPTRAARLALNMAEVYRDQGQYREALPRVEEYLRSRPRGTEGYELKVLLLKKLGRGADVVTELQAAAERDKDNPGVKLLLARECRQAGRPRDAEAVYREMLEDVAAPDVYKGLFSLYREERRVDQVMVLLDSAVKAGAGDDGGKPKKDGNPAEAAKARAMLQAIREDGELVKQLLYVTNQRLVAGPPLAYPTRMLLAGLAGRTRQLDLAEQLYRDCLTRPGGLRQAEEAEVYGGLLRILMQAHKYAAVVTVCHQGLARAQATNRVMFHLDLAEAQLALDHVPEALEAADNAVKESGEKERLLAQRVRANVLSQADKHDQAVAVCQALLREYNQAKDVRDIRITFSMVCSAARRHAQAEEQLRLVLRDDPEDATANNDLGYLWADQGQRLDEAEKLIRKALELDRRQRTGGTALGLDADRDNAAYVDSLGWVLFRCGKLAEARQELEKATTLPDGADDPLIWDHLGDVYFRLGQPGQAAAVWQKAVALYERGLRRKSDGRYKEINQKLKLLHP
jgi:tetratricopeptide (TPR) repeat protein